MPTKAPDEDDDLEGFMDIGDKPKDAEHPLLSAEDIDSVRAKVRKDLEKERRLNALEAFENQERERLRREEGLTSGVGEEDRLVWCTIDLPEWSPSVTVNGHPYWHGSTQKVPLHVHRTLMEQMQNAWRAHDQTEGKSIAQMLRPRHTVINGATGSVSNSPRRFDA